MKNIFNNERKNIILLEKKLYEYKGEDKVISFEEMQKIIGERGTPDIELKSNFPMLDKTLGGFNGGELVIVSGLTGEGKTLLCQTLTNNFSKQEIGSLWFTYEMPPQYFLQRFSKTLPFAYLPQELTSNKMDWLEERVLEAKLKFNVKAVFVDHLHFLVDLAKIGNSSLEIGSIVRNIKKVALRQNVVIFLIAHTKKIQSDRELGLGDVRDSSFIEQEADSVLYIWRKEEMGGVKVDNRSVVKIAKNRKLGIKDKKIDLILAGGNLMELDKIEAVKEQQENNDNF